MMELSDDTITVDKMLFIDNEELNTSQPTAKDLWDDFHFIESFVEVVDQVTGLPTHNQHIVLNAEKVDFTLDDWKEILSNNKFKTTTGQTGEIISIEWNFRIGTANIQYKIKQLYTKNLKLAFNEGQ
jgi:hypothetical protein